MKCYECKWLDRSVIFASNPPQYRCTLGFGSHYADHECEYDFMPIVRCKDCIHQEHCHETVAHTRHHDGFIEHWSEPIEWCSRGEHKGGDSETRPKGEWLSVEIIDDDSCNGVNEDAAECSVCGYVSESYYWAKTYYKFCPNCGVKMKGGAE